MSEVAIRVEGLSKRYALGAAADEYPVGYRSILDTVSRTTLGRVRSLVSRRRGAAGTGDRNEVWALKDVSLTVERGDVVGVIGRNGAGKSTLLKILSRITEPTAGFAELSGRVGSLLEVGTGFHYELTGRENIYLSGSIIGMKRSEMRRKFDEIVEFAEVAKFIDTQVKFYSSGMHLRLAFAVAAHLEPEILLVDEVLAVGDLAFQKKCLGKMEDVAAHGRTVLFVSHNLAAVKDLCRTAIVLQHGQVAFQGPVVEGIARYTQSQVEESALDITEGAGWHRVEVHGQRNGLAPSVETGEGLRVSAVLDLRHDLQSARLFCIMHDAVGDLVVHHRVDTRTLGGSPLTAGRHRVDVALPPLWLAPGVYTLQFKLIGETTAGADERHVSERVVLDVTGEVEALDGARLAPPAQWEMTPARVVEKVGALV
jgi:lipopolysaccharide transport system ATP-binding protein